MKTLRYVLVFGLLTALTSCSSKQESEGEDTNASKEEIMIEDSSMFYITYVNMDSIASNLKEVGFSDPADFNEFKAQYPSEVIDDVTYYVVEGDLFYNDEQMWEYYQSFNYSGSSEKLVGEIRNGSIVRTPEPENISYAIIKQSFSNIAEYQGVVDFMTEAGEDWSDVCNVSFKHLSHLDTELGLDDNPDSLTFVVKKHYFSGTTIARAFFPYYPKSARKVLIGQSFFTSHFSKSGMLRHELGHVLGFRHEHIRSGAPAICLGENTTGTINLSDYDPKSVMHYFCGGVGSRDLLITRVDSIGASRIYPF